jgi:hypothetical protein
MGAWESGRRRTVRVGHRGDAPPRVRDIDGSLTPESSAPRSAPVDRNSRPGDCVQ